MNHYVLEELKAGHTESFCVTVTGQMLEQFSVITGDYNPLHMNEEFARDKGYQGTVAYGMLTASFLSTLAGMYLPGENSLIHSVETKFLKPVYVGDTLKISGTIAETDERFSIIYVKVIIENQNQEKVAKGNMRIGAMG